MEINLDMSTFDFETLTLGEAEAIEDKLGTSLAAAQDASQVKLMRALVWVVLRREDPDFTYEATADIAMSDLVSLAGEEGDPTEAL